MDCIRYDRGALTELRSPDNKRLIVLINHNTMEIHAILANKVNAIFRREMHLLISSFTGRPGPKPSGYKLYNYTRGKGYPESE